MAVNLKKLFFRRRIRNRSKLRKVAHGQLRLSVHRSSKNISVQLIDDSKGITLASASTLEKSLNLVGKNNIAASMKIGEIIAKRAATIEIKKCYFDRGALIFHGKIKALADAARDGGLQF